jgi:hypothetical protein
VTTDHDRVRQSFGANVIQLGFNDPRKETWTFADGTEVTITVPSDEPPITVKHAVYCLSDVLFRIHTGMHQ